MTAQELYNLLWARKSHAHPYAGYAELTRPLTVRPWHVPPGTPPAAHDTLLPAGTTVRIVFVTRTGEIGLTPHLDDPRGGGCFIRPADGLLTNCRLEREPVAPPPSPAQEPGRAPRMV